MNAEVLVSKLQKKKSVYIKDDFEQKAIRITPTKSGSVVFAKFKGREEYSIDSTAKLVLDIQMGGEEISKEEYENY